MTETTGGDVLQLLQTGTVAIEGLLPWSSNYTFLVRVCEGQEEIGAVYKPQRGERPLWDFPQGTLCNRERAAYLVSTSLGWDIVPPTVLREGQHGLGSMQLFIDHDPERHYFAIEGDERYRDQLQKIALLDVVINNADRKAGHVLLQEDSDPDGTARLWGIDHGICFHADAKLRTVIWEFGGSPIPETLHQDLAGFRTLLEDPGSSLRLELAGLLTEPEIDALCRRMRRLVDRGKFPHPGAGRHYPWPPV